MGLGLGLGLGLGFGLGFGRLVEEGVHGPRGEDAHEEGEGPDQLGEGEERGSGWGPDQLGEGEERGSGWGEG